MSQSPDKNAIRKDSYFNCFETVVKENLSVNATNDGERSNSEKPEVIMIGDSVLHNINGCGSCKLKTKEVSVKNVPGTTRVIIVDKTENQLAKLPEKLVVDVGINDLPNDINLLNNIKKIFSKAKQKSPNSKLAYSNIIFGNKIRNIENELGDTNATIPQLIAIKSKAKISSRSGEYYKVLILVFT